MSDLSTESLRPTGEIKPIAKPALVLTVLTHPRLAMIGARAEVALDRGGSVPLSRNTPEFLPAGRSIGEPLGDLAISRSPLVFRTGRQGALQLLRGDNPSSVRIDNEPMAEECTLPRGQLDHGVCLTLSERVVLLVQMRRNAKIERSGRDLGMIGQSEALAAIRAEIVRVASLNVPVLIRGETGTGKELVARALHEQSRRAGRPFVAVNIGALPQTLAAAELFGVRRGAYTGASVDKRGYFRAAHGGTLFLDEIGEAPLEIQVMLLRLLETNQITPLGTHELTRVDVRLVAASDADLEARIAAGAFREPLLHRLAAYEIDLPPLRHRREDIGPLFLHFARETLAELDGDDLPDTLDPFAGPWLPAELAVRLARCPWPGNIRQLRNLVRKLVIANQGRNCLQLTPRLERILAESPGDPPPHPAKATQQRRKPSQVSHEELEEALRQADWEPKTAAEILELARSSVYDLIRKSPHIRTAADLSAEEITRSHQQHRGALEAMASELRVSKPALRRRIEAMDLTC